jgi:hypothetical protein
MIDTSFPGFAALMNGLGARIAGPMLAKPKTKAGRKPAAKKKQRAERRGRARAPSGSAGGKRRGRK